MPGVHIFCRHQNAHAREVHVHKEAEKMTSDKDDGKKAPEKICHKDGGDPCWTRPFVSVKSQDRKDI